jgi:hypothetical protein
MAALRGSDVYSPSSLKGPFFMRQLQKQQKTAQFE